jgi:prevent-host-death family protein
MDRCQCQTLREDELMDENTHAVSVSQFRARCLAIIDEVARTRVPVVVTKSGKPVARLVPLEEEDIPSLLGSVSYRDESDLIDPVDEPWEADR